MSTITIGRSVVEQALAAFSVATTPLARDRQEVLRAIEELRAALEQPQVEQAPVAWLHSGGKSQPLYLHPQPKRGPLPEDLKLAIESMIESHESGDLDGWEVQLVKRRLHEAINGIGGEK